MDLVREPTHTLRVLWITTRWLDPVSTQSFEELSIDSQVDVSVLAILPSRELDQANPIELSEKWRIQEARVLAQHDRTLGSETLSKIIRFLFRSFVGFSFLPVGARKIREKSVTWIKSGTFDVIVMDGLHSAMIFESRGEVKLPPLPVLYRVSEIETDLWRRRVALEKNWIFRQALERQLSWVERFERSLIKKSSYVLPVSVQDKEKISTTMHPQRIEVYPVGAAYGSQPPVSQLTSDKITVGLRGKEGADWIAEEIWPAAKKLRPDLTLMTIGEDEDPSGFYQKIDLLLVPKMSGIESRRRAVEASQHARACLGDSTSLSALDPKACFTADSKNAWIEILLCLQAKDVAHKGQVAWFTTREKYDAGSCGEILLRAILKSCGRLAF